MQEQKLNSKPLTVLCSPLASEETPTPQKKSWRPALKTYLSMSGEKIPELYTAAFNPWYILEIPGNFEKQHSQ